MLPVPPVYSPLLAGALRAGVRTVVSGEQGIRSRVAARIKRHFHARSMLFTDSGTSALMVALSTARSLREGGTSVALPAFGCFDLATAVRGANVRPVLYDLEPATLSPEPNSLRRSLESGAGVLIAAHLYGVPVDLDELEQLARDTGALLLEDAAQGVGAAYRGRPLGSHGSLSVLSFGRGKGLTGGGGGALLAHDDRGAAVVREAGHRLQPANRGIMDLLSAAGQWAFGRPGWYGLPKSVPILRLGETVYRRPSVPRRAPASCLAVLERNWDASLREAGVRVARAEEFSRIVQNMDDLEEIRLTDSGTPGFLRLPVLARSDAARNELSSARAERLGVMRSYPSPLYRLDGVEWNGPSEVGPEAFSGAEALATSLFTLPVHSRVPEGAAAGVRDLLERTRHDA